MPIVTRTGSLVFLSLYLLLSLCVEQASAEFSYPWTRYTAYDKLTDEEKAAASVLGYNEGTWNLPTANRKEFNAYYFLTNKERAALEVLGFTPDDYDDVYDEAYSETWDCYINHYEGYVWSELPANGQKYYRTLGYDPESWDGNKKVAAPDKYWDDLTKAEKNAAYNMCYFEETWNEEVAIPDWDDCLTTPSSPCSGAFGVASTTSVTLVSMFAIAATQMLFA